MAGSRNGLKKACALTVKRRLYRRFGRPALVSRKIGEKSFQPPKAGIFYPSSEMRNFLGKIAEKFYRYSKMGVDFPFFFCYNGNEICNKGGFWQIDHEPSLFAHMV